MSWLKNTFGVNKPVIAMCHMPALPGDPRYDVAKGLAWLIEHTRQDLHALQDGGVDAIMFSNEASTPYLTRVELITPVTMARIIGELRREISVPFGVNVLWMPRHQSTWRWRPGRSSFARFSPGSMPAILASGIQTAARPCGISMPFTPNT